MLLMGRRYSQKLFWNETEIAKLTRIIALDIFKSECIWYVNKI